MSLEFAANVKDLIDIAKVDPDKFTYDNLKDYSKVNGIDINDVSEAMKISVDTTRKNAKKNNGVIGPKYFYILVGMIAIRKQSKIKIVD